MTRRRRAVARSTRFRRGGIAIAITRVEHSRRERRRRARSSPRVHESIARTKHAHTKKTTLTARGQRATDRVHTSTRFRPNHFIQRKLRRYDTRGLENNICTEKTCIHRLTRITSRRAHVREARSDAIGTARVRMESCPLPLTAAYCCSLSRHLLALDISTRGEPNPTAKDCSL